MAVKRPGQCLGLASLASGQMAVDSAELIDELTVRDIDAVGAVHANGTIQLTLKGDGARHALDWFLDAVVAEISVKEEGPDTQEPAEQSARRFIETIAKINRNNDMPQASEGVYEDAVRETERAIRGMQDEST